MNVQGNKYRSDSIHELLQHGYSLHDVLRAKHLYKSDTGNIDINEVIAFLQPMSIKQRTQTIRRHNKPRTKSETHLAKSRRNHIQSKRWSNLYDHKPITDHECDSGDDIERHDEYKCTPKPHERHYAVRGVEVFDKQLNIWIPAKILLPIHGTNTVCIELPAKDDEIELSKIKIVSLSEIRDTRDDNTQDNERIPSLCDLSAEVAEINRKCHLNKRMNTIRYKYRKIYTFGTAPCKSKITKSLGLHEKQMNLLLQIVSLCLNIGLSIACPGLPNLIRAVAKCVEGDYKGAIVSLAFGVTALISFGIGQIEAVDEFIKLMVDYLELDSLSSWITNALSKLFGFLKPFTQFFLIKIDVFFDEISSEIIDGLYALGFEDEAKLNKCVILPLKKVCGEVVVCVDKLQVAMDNDTFDKEMLQKVDRLMNKAMKRVVEDIPKRMMVRKFNISHHDAQKNDFRDVEDIEDLMMDVFLDKIIENIPNILDKQIDQIILDRLTFVDVVCSEDIACKFKDCYKLRYTALQLELMSDIV
eukprot:276038_1